MAKVYVTQHDGHFDLDDAMRYGQLKVIFTRDIYPDDADEQMPKQCERALRVLADFDADRDYLCLIGSPLYVAACSWALGALGIKRFNVLRFDKIEKAYYTIAIGSSQ